MAARGRKRAIPHWGNRNVAPMATIKYPIASTKIITPTMCVFVIVRLSRLTIWLTDPAPVMPGTPPRRNPEVRCRGGRRHGSHLCLVNHHHATPARTRNAIVPPQSHATERRDRLSNSDSPSKLRSRISESACHMRATSSMRSPSMTAIWHGFFSSANVLAQARRANGVRLSTET